MSAAVFIDVESLTGWLKTRRAEAELSRLVPDALVRRAYGNFTNPSVHARQRLLSELGFELVHVFHPVRGKDSADIQMIVDAMDYLARMPDLRRFVLATGDSDFSPLFRRLRELGKEVIGVGPRSALSDAVRTSVSRYVFIDGRMGEGDPHVDDAFAQALRAFAELPSPVSLSQLKNQLLKTNPKFNERKLGFKRFVDFVGAVDGLVAQPGPKSAWYVERVEDELARRRRAQPRRPPRVRPEPAPAEPAARLQLVFDTFADG